jgi:hypothetical protein
LPISKSLRIAFWITLIISGLAFTGALHPTIGQSGTNVTGIINTNTTWTKANSPCNLVGPVGVSKDVTLTIEAGATVNLNSNYLQVNGTMRAVGTSKDQIYINGGNLNPGYIEFTPLSNGYEKQTGSGNMIENTNLKVSKISSSNTILITNSNIIAVGGGLFAGGSSVILNTTLSGPLFVDGSSQILNSGIYGELSGSAALISNNILTIVNIDNAAVISNNNVGIVNASLSTIINNTVTGGKVVGTTISNNTITGNVAGTTITSNTIIGDVTVTSGIVSNNSIIGVYWDVYKGAIGAGYAVQTSGSCIVSNNRISGEYYEGQGVGVVVQSGFTDISGNKISGFETGIGANSNGAASVIEKNLIFNNTKGCFGFWQQVTIQNNTVFNNSIGFSLYSVPSSFTYNNIQNNTQNVVLVSTPNNVNATYNWWGTTDIAAINQTIHDYKNDFNLGNVTFIPFLTSPNPQAPSIPTSTPSPTPTQTPSPSMTTTPSIPEYPSFMITALVMAAIVVITIFYKGRHNKLKQV